MQGGRTMKRALIAIALVAVASLPVTATARTSAARDGQVKHAMTEAGIYNFSGGVADGQL